MEFIFVHDAAKLSGNQVYDKKIVSLFFSPLLILW